VIFGDDKRLREVDDVGKFLRWHAPPLATVSEPTANQAELQGSSHIPQFGLTMSASGKLRTQDVDSCKKLQCLAYLIANAVYPQGSNSFLRGPSAAAELLPSILISSNRFVPWLV
jgi:hypothetical protein